ncbi:MAG: purine-nucleoside phosphorylase [Dehalococcoidia bacterium]|nr:MAG: purine-nucleoside phosphorylase [Dehalococcoidia bacterium]
MKPIHVRAAQGDVAPIVLLVGDPGRATRTAEIMGDAACYNEFRGLLGYTGTHDGVRVSVQTTGMGCPSAAIVCEELAMLGARVLIRLGTCGAVQAGMRATDIVIATAACPLDGTTSDYTDGEPYAPAATFRVVRALVDAAAGTGVRFHTGLIATEDALYRVREAWAERWQARGVLAQEMEASAIFTVAALRGMEAGCILVASNHAGQHERLPDDELRPAIDAMIGVGLRAAVSLSS